MKFVDLAAQQARIRIDIEKRLQAVLDHGRYVDGPEIAELEEALAAHIGARHAVACSSGTDALLMALMTLDIGRGDAVFTTPFSFFATGEVIRLLGATPVFVDIDPATFNLDPKALDDTLEAIAGGDYSLPGLKQFRKGAKLTPKAVIPVDLFGLPAEYDPIAAIADKYGLPIIEDAAQSFGARYKGRGAGTMGDIGCTSFFPAKPLGGYGDGGMCFTDRDGVAENLMLLRNHGQGRERYAHTRIGLNARMDTFQAAVLLAKYKIFADECVLRNHIAARYHQLLAHLPHLVLPVIPAHCSSVWAQYAVLAESKEQRVAIAKQLNEQDIPTAIYYPCPIHMLEAMIDLGHAKGDFPVSEDCADRIFSIPMHPYLTEGEQKRIAALIGKALERIE